MRKGSASATYSTLKARAPQHVVYSLFWAGAISPFECGTPGRIRTADLLLRRQTLYPAELRAHITRLHFNCSPRLPKASNRLSMWYDAVTDHFISRRGG